MILTKDEYIKNLHKTLEAKLKELADKKGLAPEDYEGVKGIIIDTAEFSFNEGFNAARLTYAVACVTQIGEVFKE